MANKQFTSNFIDKSASASPVDVGAKYVSKEYLMDVYPTLAPNMKAPALWTWGNGVQCGLGNGFWTNEQLTYDVLTPIQTTAGGTNWKQMNTAYTVLNNIALKTDGTLWAWGMNYDGQFGNSNTVSASSPVPAFGGTSYWVYVSCSGHSLAIKNDGTLWATGQNGFGALGDGTQNSISSPIQIGSDNTWKQVSANSGDSSFGVKYNGTLWGWGSNIGGQLGITGAATDAGAVVLVPTQIGTGTDWQTACNGTRTSLALKNEGSIWSWGTDTWGELGNGAVSGTMYSTPVQVGTQYYWKFASGKDTSKAAIKTDGTLWMWGENTDGELGQGDTVHRSTPTKVGTGTNWKYVEAAHRSTYAIKTDGTLWVWGKNHHGQLGLGHRTDLSTPTLHSTNTNWKSVDTGYYIVRAIAEAEGY